MIIDSAFTPIPFTISMYNYEQESFKRVYDSISELYSYLENHGANRMVCTDTAEVIEADELLRVRGILDGLIRRYNWEGRAE